MKQKEQKLDTFSKILLATSTINYMANTLNSITIQTRILSDAISEEKPDSITAEIIRNSANDKCQFLNEMSIKLNDVLEEIGNYLNNIDAVSAIDMRVSQVPCNILLHKLDEVDKFYDEEYKEN